MGKIQQFCALAWVFFLPILNHAQEIPIDGWRIHASFHSIHSVSLGTNNVYAASQNGVLIFDKTDNSVSTLTKLDGLSSTNITQVTVDQSRGQLLISYADGDLDIVKAGEIINYDGLKNSPTITGSRKINHIFIHNNFAYLSADYGMVVFDLIQLQVKETWRDIGPAGEKIAIHQSTFNGDSIFLATERGVLAGDLNDNLLDFNNWRRFDTGAFNGGIQTIATFNNAVYAAINSSGIHRYENGSWVLESFLQGLTFKNITASLNHLLITEGNNVHQVNTMGAVTLIASDKITEPLIAWEDATGEYWIGDDQNGLVSDISGSFERYVKNGPSFSGGLRLRYDQGSNKIFSVSGGYSSSFIPLLKTEPLNFFSAGSWSVEDELLNEDLTDVAISGNRMILSSFGKGVQVIENGAIVFEDEVTAPNVTALKTHPSGFLVTNYGSVQSLRLLKSDYTWQAFSFPAFPAARYPTELLVDYLGHVWMILNPALGGGLLVFDMDTNETVYLTEVSGSGGLPSKSVYSLALDRDGQVWVGTASGVAYFPSPGSVFDGSVNAVKPVFDNRFLLRDEKVTAIEADGGNRKWMGTERGVWLVDPFGEVQVSYYTAANSPLLSDKIIDIEINGKSGEVFFITDKGIASYRSNATASDAAFHSVKIFPNPVTPDFNGQVGISGLSVDSFVKITDVSGKLIWQTQANGGTASWNVRDYNGRRAATGMYLVFCTSEDGSESIVGKIAVVD